MLIHKLVINLLDVILFPFVFVKANKCQGLYTHKWRYTVILIRITLSVFYEYLVNFETSISRAEIFRAFYSQTDLFAANIVGRNTVIRYAESEVKSDWSVGMVSSV